MSANRCTFCTYDFRTGKRGAIDPPPPGAARECRAKGVLLVAFSVPAVLLSILLIVFPVIPFARILAMFFFVPAAGGVAARGLTLLAQARRWDLKPKLYEESRVGAGGPTSSVAV